MEIATLLQYSLTLLILKFKLITNNYVCTCAPIFGKDKYYLLKLGKLIKISIILFFIYKSEYFIDKSNKNKYKITIVPNIDNPDYHNELIMLFRRTRYHIHM